MITFATDDNNDFIVGQNGNLTMIKDRQAIAQESKHFIATLRGEMIHAIDEGIPYFRDALNKQPNLSAFEFAIRKRLSTLPEIRKIVSLNTFVNNETLGYSIVIQSIYGEVIESGQL